MDEQAIRKLVERVLQEQSAPTLMVLTPASGYHKEIAARLSQWTGIRWAILADEATKPELAAMASLGQTICWDGSQPAEWLGSFEQVVFPFLDFATLAEISLGLYQSRASQLCQYALMKGMPVYALDYQCNPASELNQLMGLDRSQAMTVRAQAQLAQLQELGIAVGSIEQVEAMMAGGKSISTTESISEKSSSYVTLSDVKSKGVNAFTLQDNLTDLAAEYLKEQRQ
ncbi:hypothetical protein [uncultured Photobacterium sp.]|uniref:hypothetical protein n=1 Tax=uncultured Photobacterium sp. TaxID=173973 RepID=UPI00261F21C7|nr:hypothetical protein [uncultured Photobacterium sp.]